MINRATLTGRLTNNIALRYTPSGIAVGNFTLAVDRNFTNKNGQRGADFIRCTIWRKPAENLANFTHKGSLIGIDGQIRTGSYQNQQGETVYTTQVVVDNFALLEPKSSNGQQGAPQQRPMPQQQPRQPQQPMPNRNNPQPNGNQGNQPNQSNMNGNGNNNSNNPQPNKPQNQNGGNQNGGKKKITDDSLPF